jgi:hypothetical protein
MRHYFVKLATVEETIEYAEEFMTNKDHQPIRIDISRNINGIKISENLHLKMIDAIKALKLDMEAEVHLYERVNTESETSFYVEHGKIGTSHRNKRVGREVIRELSNQINPNDLTEYFQGFLFSRPGLLPIKINIVYKEDDDKDLALQITQVIEGITKKSGIEKLVEINIKQADPFE